jgi:ribosomal protein S12 methylthiotransferase
LKVHLTSLGCAKNQVDSEWMLGLFLAQGHLLCETPDEADAIIVNTCAFIESAVEEAIDTILELAKFKSGDGRLIVCGCLPERYRQGLAESLPEVDYFFGTGAYGKVADALKADIAGLDRCTLPPPGNVCLNHAVAGRNWPRAGSAYLKVAEGCDRHCTYCIIPRLRGRQRSRPPQDIIAEATALAASGARELVLISQETSAYGNDLIPRPDLTELLVTLSERLPAVWLRLLYLHPESVTPRLIRTIAERDNICPYFDIPIQYAGDRILKRMGRHHRAAELRRLFGDIRRVIPEAALRTTVMVGFPGESDADMEALLNFIKEIEFDHLGAFRYSDSEEIASHHLAGHVPGAVAEERFDRLMAAQARISSARNNRRVGETYPVLLEKQTDGRSFEGRTMFQAPEVDGNTRVVCEQAAAPGDVVAVRIIEATEYDLTGKAV